ncbi:MAG: hypothetical protein Q9M37_06470 [Desulfonauticus sp.]|nr:hypothetical protein [Desulfonauticus sp.]
MLGMKLIFKENTSLSLFVFLSSTFLLCFVCLGVILFYNGQKLYNNAGYVEVDVIWKSNLPVNAISKQIDKIVNLYGFVFVKNIAQNDLDLFQGISEPFLNEITLPLTSVFKYKITDSNRKNLSSTLNKIKSLPEVKGIVYSDTKLSILNNWHKFRSRVILPLGVGLVATVFILIIFSLRLLLLDKREEIEVLYLVGASPFYVLKPLILFSGLLLTLSGILALTFAYSLFFYLKNVGLWFGLALSFLPLSYLFTFFIFLLFISMLASLTAFFAFQKKL